ncbi:MAG: hypothetical protein WA441_03060 [Methyloceanibacter sp.]
MLRGRVHLLATLLVAAAMALMASASVMAAHADAIESDLAVVVQGSQKQGSLDEALALLNIPSVSIAFIDKGSIAFARVYGEDATQTRSIRQPRSRNSSQPSAPCVSVNNALTAWRVPSNPFDATHKVTLRGLLSMTGGIGVPGFLGYAVGRPIPALTQVLDGAPSPTPPPSP